MEKSPSLDASASGLDAAVALHTAVSERLVEHRRVTPIYCLAAQT